MESKNLTTCSTCGMAYSIQKFAIVRTAEEKKSLWEGLPEEMKKTLEIKVNLNKVHKEPEFFFGQSRICNGCNKNFCSAECRFQHFQVCEYKPCVEERRTEKKRSTMKISRIVNLQKNVKWDVPTIHAPSVKKFFVTIVDSIAIIAQLLFTKCVSLDTIICKQNGNPYKVVANVCNLKYCPLYLMQAVPNDESPNSPDRIKETKIN